MEGLAAEQIKVKSGLPILAIIKCGIDAAYGEHVKAEIIAVAEAEEVKESFAKIWEEGIKIYDSHRLANDFAEERMIFKGMISKVEITLEGRYASLSLSAVSNTWKMDIEKKSRSFQDITWTYRGIAKKIAEEYGADLVWNIPDKQIERPFIQYQETDYQFIKRIASHLKSGIIAEGAALRPCISVGLQEQEGYREIDLRHYVYSTFPYHGKIENVGQRKMQIGYCIRNMDSMRIGEKIRIQGCTFYVMEWKKVFEKGAWIYECSVFPKDCFEKEAIPAKTLRGATLNGTVLETRGEYMKMHLDIDADQPVSKAYEFLWKPITGNMVYCMPEKGTRAALYFGGAEEKAGSVIYSIRENGGQNKELSNVEDRYFTTDKGKRLYLKPKEMGLLHMEEANAEIAIRDSVGLHMKTKNKISIQAEGQVQMKGKKVVLMTPREATVVRKDLLSPTVINLCNAFDAIGRKANFAPMPQIEEKKKKKVPVQKTEEYVLDDILGDILSNIPSDGGEDAAMECISGSMPIISGVR